MLTLIQTEVAIQGVGKGWYFLIKMLRHLTIYGENKTGTEPVLTSLASRKMQFKNHMAIIPPHPHWDAKL